MASGKRQPSKQKRTNQNRQERAARQARATNAAASSSPSSSGSSSGGGAARGSLLGRLRGAASGVAPAPRPSASSSSSSSSSGGGSARPAPARPAPGAQPPGYRAALTALLAAIAAVVASFFLHQPVDAQGDIYDRPGIVAEWSTSALQEAQAAPTADADAIVKAVGDDWMPHRTTERAFVAYLPLSLGAFLPVLAAYLLFRAVQQRRGSKVVNRAMYAVLLGAFISFPLMTYFLPAVIGAWVAGFQARKADRNELLAAQAEAGEASDVGGGDVIEATVVDEVDAKHDEG